MKKILLPIITIVFMTIFTSPAHAASLDVSKNANFSTNDLNFSGGEKVYVRVESDGSGSSQKTLNIRDNKYNLVSSVDLSKSGNTFSASFNAPNTQGYFSLEAVVEGEGKVSKSVKTIKVGSPTSANIKVNVESSVKGTKSTNAGQSQSQGEKVENEEDNDVVSSPTPEVYSSQSDSSGQVKPAKSNWFFMIVGNILSFLWPFK